MTATFDWQAWHEQRSAWDRLRAKAPKVDARTNTADLTHLPDSTRCADLMLQADIMLQVSVRTWHLIAHEGIHRGLTLGHLRRMSDAEILRLPNFGRVSHAEFRRVFGPPQTQDPDNLRAERAALMTRLVEIDDLLLETTR